MLTSLITMPVSRSDCMMDSDENDSVFSVVKQLSIHLSEKDGSENNALGPQDRVRLQKQYFKLAYECFLKKRTIIEDDSPFTALDDVLDEIKFTLHLHYKDRINEVKQYFLPVFNKLESLKLDEDEENTIVSLLKIILMLYKRSGRSSFVKSYGRCRLFRPLSEFLEDWNSKLRSSKSQYFFPETPSIIRNDPSIRNMFYRNKPAKYPVVNGVKKSLSWHERIGDYVSDSHPLPAILPSSSQNWDEGYVTPNDDHREVTPVPSKKEDKWKDSCEKYFTWDVLKDPPMKFYSWDAVGYSFEQRWKSRKVSNRTAKNIGHQSGSPPPSISGASFYRDVSSLLTGLPSSTFTQVGDKFVMAEKVIYVDSEPVYEEDCYEHMECGIYYYSLQNFVQTKWNNTDSVVLHTLCQVLSMYLSQYAAMVLQFQKTNQMKANLKMFLHSRELLHFMWKRISDLGNNFSCHRLLDSLHSSLHRVMDPKLLSLIIIILSECTDTYLQLFKLLIHTGETHSDLGVKNWIVDRVPSYLGEWKEAVSSSFNTIHLLQKCKPILNKKREVTKKISIDTLKLKEQAEKALKDHLAKFLREQQEKHEAIDKIKQERLKEILDDIASKQEWKEMEKLRIDEKDKKIASSYEKVDKIKAEILEEAKAKVISDFEALSREAERKSEVIQWKTKRLELSENRNQLLNQEMKERKEYRLKCEKEGIDLKEANAHLLAEPVIVKLPPLTPLDVVDHGDVCYSRLEDAKENKVKAMSGSSAWKFDPSLSNYDQENYTIDQDLAFEEYKSNKLKAAATKKAVMSSEIGGISYNFEEKLLKKYKGLDEEEHKELNMALDNLIIPTKDYPQSIDYEGILQNLRHTKAKTFMSFKHVDFDKRPTYSNFVEDLTSCGDALKLELKAAHQKVMDLLKDDFLSAVSSVRDYFLLGNCSWKVMLTNDLVEFMTNRNKLRYISLNHLLPQGFSTLTISDRAVNSNQEGSSSKSEKTDSFVPGSLDCFTLSYHPPHPIEYLLTEEIIEKYRKLFNLLKKLECGSRMLDLLVGKLKTKKAKSHYVNIEKIELYRHIMSHFMISLRSFIYNAIEAAWSSFNAAAEKVESIDVLFKLHYTFLNKISETCCLKKAVRLLECVNKVVRSVYLFCGIMNSCEWTPNDEGQLVNSKYSDLEVTFETFFRQTRILYNYLLKLLESGYNASIANLKYSLGINNFYENFS